MSQSQHKLPIILKMYAAQAGPLQQPILIRQSTLLQVMAAMALSPLAKKWIQTRRVTTLIKAPCQTGTSLAVSVLQFPTDSLLVAFKTGSLDQQ